MTVHVGELSTEVQTVPEPSPSEAKEEVPRWVELAKLRARLAQLARDQARTRAEGFDD